MRGIKDTEESLPDFVWRDWRQAKAGGGVTAEFVGGLVDADPRVRMDAQNRLRASVTTHLQWCRAGASSATALLDAVPTSPDPALLLVLLADLLGADHVCGWLSPHDAPLSSVQAPIHDVVLRRRIEIEACLNDSRSRVSASATVVAAQLGDVGQQAARLTELAQGDDSLVRASALLALARFGEKASDVSSLLNDALSDDSGMVQAAAALACLRSSEVALDTFREPLLRGLAWRPRDYEEQWPWFDALSPVPWLRGIGGADAVPRALVAIAVTRGETAVAELIDFVGNVTDDSSLEGSVETQAAKILVALFDWAGGVTALPSELSPRQMRIATQVGDSSMLPGAGYGWPASGNVRRRWIGRLPPGPLDRLVALDVEGAAREIPLWRAIAVSQEKGERCTPFPPELDDVLDGHDRWQAIVEYAAKSFSHAATMSVDDVERELARTPQDAALVERAVSVADDLTKRLEACRAIRDVVPVPVMSYAASTMLFVPLLRANHPFEQRWCQLMYLGAEERVRWILDRLSIEHREQAMLSLLTQRSPSGADEIRRVMLVADAAPVTRVAEALLRAIEQQLRPEPLMARYRELADEHVAFRECVA